MPSSVVGMTSLHPEDGDKKVLRNVTQDFESEERLREILYLREIMYQCKRNNYITRSFAGLKSRLFEVIFNVIMTLYYSETLC
jgi:hypothetical protein